MFNFPGLECKNCSRTMPLPSSGYLVASGHGAGTFRPSGPVAIRTRRTGSPLFPHGNGRDIVNVGPLASGMDELDEAAPHSLDLLLCELAERIELQCGLISDAYAKLNLKFH